MLLKPAPALERRSKELGFSRALFEGQDFVVIRSRKHAEIIKSISQARKRRMMTVYRADSTTPEALLRLVLEKMDIDIVYGQELIHHHDSLHFLRSGLDSILAPIAAQRGKTIAFSFHDILQAADRAKVLGRMRFNTQLCRKYKLKMLFSTFAEEDGELRAAADLMAWGRVLGINAVQI